MYVRLITVNADPARVDSSVEYVEQTARPQVEATAGNKGLAIFTGVDAPTAVAASYWEDADALQASGTALAPLREELKAAAGGSLGVEEYEVAIGFRQSIPARGAVVRLSRMEMEPSVVDDAVAFTQDNSMSRVKGAPGLCSFQWLIDRDSGKGMVATAWEDERAADDFWNTTAQELRAQVADRVGITYTGREEYRMVHTSVQLG